MGDFEKGRVAEQRAVLQEKMVGWFRIGWLSKQRVGWRGWLIRGTDG